MATVQGVRKTTGRLKKLERAVINITKASVTASGRVIVKAIKREIPSTLKDGRKAIGFRFSRGKGRYKGRTFAKVGVGVGLRKSKMSKQRDSNRPGVGISASNFHWFVLGTDKRYTGSKRVGAHRKGVKNARAATGSPVRYTGRMKPDGVVQRGLRASRWVAKKAMVTGFLNGVKREWKKL